MPRQRNPLSSQVLVITGATSCIGLATARMAARHGAKLVLAASNATTLDRLASEIRQAGGDVVSFPVDVAIKEQVMALGRMAMQRFGRIDTWINAGMAMDSRNEPEPAPVAARLFKAHYWGAAYGASVALDLMKQAGGTIINLDSEASARYGVKGYTDVLRTEIVKAFVVLKPGHHGSPDLATELQAFVRRRLSAHEYPREIAFRDELPMTTTGKIVRRLLRAEA